MSNVDDLLRDLKSWNLHKRINAVRKLATLSDERIVPALGKAVFNIPLIYKLRLIKKHYELLRKFKRKLRRHHHFAVWTITINIYRTEFAKAFVKLNDNRAIPILAKLLRRSNYRIEQSILEAINHFESEQAWLALCDALEMKFIVEHAAKFLCERDKIRAIKPLISAFAMKQYQNPQPGNDVFSNSVRGTIWHIQVALIELLVDIGQPAFDELVLALESENDFIRDGVAKTLAKMGDTRAIEPLQQARETTNYAIVALGYLDYDNVVDNLLELIQLPIDNPYCEEAMKLFRMKREQKAVPFLSKLLLAKEYLILRPVYLLDLGKTLEEIAPDKAQEILQKRKELQEIKYKRLHEDRKDK